MGRKVKYDHQFKLRCVEAVLKRHQTIGSVASANGFQESNLKRWIDYYLEGGPDALICSKNQIFSLDFKLKVLRCIDKGSLSLRAARIKFNIRSDASIIRWKRAYELAGISGLANKPRGKPKMNFKRAKKKTDKPLTREEELLKENEALRAENALLKKFNALIQAEELQQKQKRKP